MKKLSVFAVALAALGAAIPAYAGGCCSGSAAKGDYECSNPCPCAQAVNSLRSSGRESMAISAAVRATIAASVQKNLARV